jgi:hypothetical protein
MAKYLGKLIPYYGIKTVMETFRIDKVTSKQLDFNW